MKKGTTHQATFKNVPGMKSNTLMRPSTTPHLTNVLLPTP